VGEMPKPKRVRTTQTLFFFTGGEGGVFTHPRGGGGGDRFPEQP